VIDVQRSGREKRVEGGRENGREQQQASGTSNISPSYSFLIQTLWPQQDCQRRERRQEVPEPQRPTMMMQLQPFPFPSSEATLPESHAACLCTLPSLAHALNPCLYFVSSPSPQSSNQAHPTHHRSKKLNCGSASTPSTPGETHFCTFVLCPLHRGMRTVESGMGSGRTASSWGDPKGSGLKSSSRCRMGGDADVTSVQVEPALALYTSESQVLYP
jgi:hypothetical protein